MRVWQPVSSDLSQVSLNSTELRGEKAVDNNCNTKNTTKVNFLFVCLSVDDAQDQDELFVCLFVCLLVAHFETLIMPMLAVCRTVVN